jgi:hypothetical protein
MSQRQNVLIIGPTRRRQKLDSALWHKARCDDRVVLYQHVPRMFDAMQ